MTETTIVPQATYTRAQAAKIITTMVLGVNGAKSCVASYAPFQDVAAEHWAAGYIAFCKEQGIIDGVTDTTFDPEGTLTGYQWAKMLLAAVGFNANNELEGASWSLNTARIGHEVGLFTGDSAAADHTPLRREQAMLYAFNTLSGIKQVTYSANATNYVYGIKGYVFADGTGYTLGQKVFDLAMVEGQIIDNEAMGNANTVVDNVAYTGKWGSPAHYIAVDANTGLDLMYHAVRVWYVDGKTNTNVYVCDLAKTTTYTCMNIATGDKDVDKLPASKTVEEHDIGKITDSVEYETYLIDNSALDLKYDYAYVSLYASFGDMGRVGKDYTTVDGTSYDNDIIKTDVSDIKVGDDIVYVVASSTDKSSDKAVYVYATTVTSGVIESVKQSGGKVVSVTLTDGTVLPMSAFWNKENNTGEHIIGRNYNFVLDTHGDVIFATKNNARDLYYYTGDYRPAYEFGSWSSDRNTIEYRFINVTTGETLIVPLTNDALKASNTANKYYDVTPVSNSAGQYAAKLVTPGENPYADEYVIDWFKFDSNTSSATAYLGEQTGEKVYFNIDELTFVVAKDHGEDMTVETYNGIDDLKTDYDIANYSWFDFDNACFTVSGTTTGHKYATVVFIHEDNLDVYSDFVFVPERIDLSDWTIVNGFDVYSVVYEDAAYLEGDLIDITVAASALEGENKVLERGFYSYKYDGATNTYTVLKHDNANINGIYGHYYGMVEFVDTNNGWTIDPNTEFGALKVTDNTVIVDCTGELPEDADIEDVFYYYADPGDKSVEVRLAITIADDEVTCIYVTEEGYGSTATVTLDKALSDAGWSIVGANKDGEYVIKDAYNSHSTPLTLVNENEDLALQGNLTVTADNATVAENPTMTGNKINISVTPTGFTASGRDTDIVISASISVKFAVASNVSEYWTTSESVISVVPGASTNVVFTRQKDDTFTDDSSVEFTLDNVGTTKTVPATNADCYNSSNKALTVPFVPFAAGNYTVDIQNAD